MITDFKRGHTNISAIDMPPIFFMMLLAWFLRIITARTPFVDGCRFMPHFCRSKWILMILLDIVNCSMYHQLSVNLFLRVMVMPPRFSRLAAAECYIDIIMEKPTPLDYGITPRGTKYVNTEGVWQHATKIRHFVSCRFTNLGANDAGEIKA